MHATDIVAYTYQAETLCPSCTVATLKEQGERWMGQANEHTEIRTLAAFAGINVDDESSFDSGDFPKVVFADQIELVPDPDMDNMTDMGGTCDHCGKDLI